VSLFLSGHVADRQTVWELDQPVTRLGRSSRATLQVADPTVSKEHAEIVRRGEHWFVRDLGSRNGTRVNGVEAREPLRVAPGDLLEIGHVSLRVTAEPPPPPLRLNEHTVVGSSLHIRVDDVLAQPMRSKQDPATLVHLLAEAGRLLVLPRPLRETCDAVLEFVERAVPASRYVLLLRPQLDADPVQLAARTGGGRADQPLALSRTIMKTVMDDRVSVLTGNAATDRRFAGQMSIVQQAVHSAMAVPLFDNEQVLGLLYVDSQNPTLAFDERQLELLTLLANMAAVKITNARLLEAEQVRQRIDNELATATRIQRGLLPEKPPLIPGWSFEPFLETCYEVGGDLFDFFVRKDGHVMFVVGDVTGKGMGAALLMSSFLSALRVLYEQCHDIAELAARLGAATFRNSDASRFVTGFIGAIDPLTGRIEYVNGGHPAPLIVSESGLRAIETTGVPFGIMPEFPYTSGSFELAPGETLAVFSDGIPEAQHGEEFFDDERLREVLLKHGSATDLVTLREKVIAEVLEFAGDTPRSDDITLLLVRRERREPDTKAS
jgi:serine phosphatase RsbU (regulator of sigma subunit)/pSer/pThr/pTyr-binding forkhead associated (FHA) protein